MRQSLKKDGESLVRVYAYSVGRRTIQGEGIKHILVDEEPPFDFYDERDPIYTRPRFLPPSQVDGCKLGRTVLAEGCLLKRAKRGCACGAVQRTLST